MTAPPTAAIEVRRLTYADLPQVVAIERRAFTTPWSLAMFVLELSKPSGVCLAAEVEGELAGYLVCSRYDLVWHIMNVSVDPDRRRRGIATRAAARAVRARRRPRGAVHARGPPLQRAAPSRSTRGSASRRAGVRRRYYADNGEDAIVMWRTPATRRGSLDDVPERAAAVILALETSCDDTCAAVITPRRRDPLQRRLLPGHPRPLRRRRAGDRLAPPPRARQRRRRRRARSARAPRSTTPSWSRSRRAPGLVGALLVGVATAKGLAAARRLPLAPVDHLQGHVAANYLAPDPIEPPFLCLLASGGHTLLARVTEHGAPRAARPRRSTTRPARRSTRARGCSASATRAARRSPSSRSTATRQAFAFPTAQRVAGLDFSFAGLKTALLYKVRELGEEEAGAARADLAASYEHAIVEALIARVERALDGRAGRRGWRSAAAWRPTRRLRERAAGARRRT